MGQAFIRTGFHKVSVIINMHVSTAKHKHATGTELPEEHTACSHRSTSRPCHRASGTDGPVPLRRPSPLPRHIQSKPYAQLSRPPRSASSNHPRACMQRHWCEPNVTWTRLPSPSVQSKRKGSKMRGKSGKEGTKILMARADDCG